MGIIQVVIDFIFVTVLGEIIRFFRSPWTPKKILVSLLVLAVIAGAFFLRGDDTEEQSTALVPTVRVATVHDLASDDVAQFVGTVRSVSEVDLQSERGGRVTAVRVKAGDTIGAGTVIATLENASEQAAVLQAQGAYQAALAARNQGTVGVREAETALSTTKGTVATTLASAYNTVSGIVRSDIDTYFSNPESSVPGLRISGYGATTQIVANRAALNSTLATWQQQVAALTLTSDLSAAIVAADTQTGTVVSLVDALLTALNRDTSAIGTAEEERKARIASLTAIRGQLLSLQANLRTTQSGLKTAEDALERARINASGSNGPSATDAQVTQALGSLRAAQANLEKTIVRSPIAGTVAVLRVKTGDFLSPQTPVARITGGKGLEISIFVGDRDRNRFTVGDEVRIGANATGTVVNIAPAIDPLTQKVEVKIASGDATLVNGDTVSVALASSATTTEAKLEVPITAVKFTDTAGSVFVVEGNALKAIPVEVGTINGSRVEIRSGITAETEFVVDARGKTDGEVVEVVR